ncbi:MAG: endolytic transglycosylase MltG [Hyphomonadaceae bacterium]
MGKLLGFLFVIVLLGAGAAGAGWFWLNSVYSGAGPVSADGKPRVVLVARGASTQAIVTKLKEAGAIADAEQFRLALRLREFMGDKPVMKAGEYEIASGASMETIVKDLSTGAPLQYAVIVPEGLSVAQILGLLKDHEWKATGGPDRTYKLDGDAPKDIAEGTLLPGDYAVSRGDTIGDVIDRMAKAQKDLLAEIWDSRNTNSLATQWDKPQRAEPVKTQMEAIILASVVEKETGNMDEQPMVAAAMVNRLILGMRLQADSTTIYGITKGVPIGRSITSKELAERTPWNTYQIDGLPQTAICNPGAGAIRAVLKPARSKALYFVADGKGGHVFAESYAEHAKNVDAYWKLRKANEAAGVNTPAIKQPQ